MADLLWMPDTLRDAGLKVVEIPDWRKRGHGAMSDVYGLLMHHTVGPARGDGMRGALTVYGYPSLNVVVDGRPDLEGPLCNLGLARDGTWVVVAAGQAWHAGTGSAPWCPKNTGNTHLIGIEAESVGTRDDWTPQQREAYPRGAAALLAHLGLPPARAIGHKEWAPGRKIDPAFWDMNSFRADVARWMSITPAAPATPGRTLMATIDDVAREIAKLKPGVPLPARSRNCRAASDDHFGATLHAWAEAADGRAAVTALVAEVRALTTAVQELHQHLDDAQANGGGGEVDAGALRETVHAAVTDALAGYEVVLRAAAS